MQKPTAEKNITVSKFHLYPASNYSNSFTLLQQPQVNKITLKSGELLLSMWTRQYVGAAWSFSLQITHCSLILFIIHWLLAYNTVNMFHPKYTNSWK